MDMRKVWGVLLAALLWRCPLLPAFSMRMFYVVWGISFALIVGNVTGGLAGWWTSDNNLGLFLTIVNVMLCFTPLESVHWFCRRANSQEELMYISAKQARALIADPAKHMEVHRVVMCRGRMVRGGRVA